MASNYKAAKLKYHDIREGDFFAFDRKIGRKDILEFSKLTGDFNSLHIKDNVAHGMLSGSLFSVLVGMHCPGERSLYLNQTLNFRHPIYAGDRVTVRGTVINKSDSTEVITLKTEILKKGKVMVDGEAKVKVRVLDHE